MEKQDKCKICKDDINKYHDCMNQICCKEHDFKDCYYFNKKCCDNCGHEIKDGVYS